MADERASEGLGQGYNDDSARTPVETSGEARESARSHSTRPVSHTGQRFDGRETITPRRGNLWSDNDTVYSDPQAFGSTIGDVPAPDSYGDVSGMYNAALAPMQQQQDRVTPTRPNNAGETQDGSRSHRGNPVADQLNLYAQQQMAANAAERSAVMRMFLADASDKRSWRLSQNGRRD